MNTKKQLQNLIRTAQNQIECARGSRQTLQDSLRQLSTLINQLPDDVQTVEQRQQRLSIVFMTKDNIRKLPEVIESLEGRELDVLMVLADVPTRETYQSLLIASVIAHYKEYTVGSVVDSIVHLERAGVLSHRYE